MHKLLFHQKAYDCSSSDPKDETEQENEHEHRRRQHSQYRLRMTRFPGTINMMIRDEALIDERAQE